MELGLTVIATKEVDDKVSLIYSLSDELKEHFKDSQYGNGIRLYIIGIVCVAPEFIDFFKIKKPRYRKGRTENNEFSIPIIIENCYECEIGIDFEDFVNADNKEAKKILAVTILVAVGLLDKMKSKIKDFDNDRFTTDLKEYFVKHGLI